MADTNGDGVLSCEEIDEFLSNKLKLDTAGQFEVLRKVRQNLGAAPEFLQAKHDPGLPNESDPEIEPLLRLNPDAAACRAALDRADGDVNEAAMILLGIM